MSMDYRNIGETVLLHPSGVIHVVRLDGLCIMCWAETGERITDIGEHSDVFKNKYNASVETWVNAIMSNYLDSIEIERTRILTELKHIDKSLAKVTMHLSHQSVNIINPIDFVH
jgi:hypothetical protein